MYFIGIYDLRNRFTDKEGSSIIKGEVVQAYSYMDECDKSVIVFQTDTGYTIELPRKLLDKITTEEETEYDIEEDES